jgi:hypothetical protein
MKKAISSSASFARTDEIKNNYPGGYMKNSEIKLLNEVNEYGTIYITFIFWNVDCQLKKAKREFAAMNSLVAAGKIVISKEYLGKFSTDLGMTFREQYTLRKVA